MDHFYTIKDQLGIYFLTFQVVNWVDVFTRFRYRDILVNSFKYCIANKGLNVYAWVIMSNHVHCILSGDNNLSGIIRDLKRHTSKAIVSSIANEQESRREWMLFQFNIRGKINRRNNNYQFWTQENHAVQILSASMLEKISCYIHDNPVRAGWVDEPHHYKYSSAIDYVGGKGLLRITEM